MIHFTSPAGWLPVHWDQLRAQRSVTSMGKLYFYLYYCTKYILFPWIKCNIGKYRAAFLAYWHCLRSMQSRIHETVLCPFVPSGRCSRFAAVGVVCGDIDHLLHNWFSAASASSVTLSADVGSWTQTCYALVHTFASLKNDIGTQQPFWFILEGVAVIHCVSKNDTDVACYNFNAR